MNAVFDFNTATRQDARPVRNRARGVVNPAEAFREFLLSRGLHPGGSVAPTGDRVQRCPADGDKPGRTSGWYVFVWTAPAPERRATGRNRRKLDVVRKRKRLA